MIGVSESIDNMGLVGLVIAFLKDSYDVEMCRVAYNPNSANGDIWSASFSGNRGIIGFQKLSHMILSNSQLVKFVSGRDKSVIQS
jgi:hypothetical protein